jgi:ElaB/YqjD/DUF883 family membrane-anchored ribosome-binding protein
MNSQTLSKPTQAVRDDLHQLTEDAKALLAATADVAGDNIAEARKRLAGGVEQCYARAREGATVSTEAVDTAIRANPYPAIIAGVGLGAILGYLIASRGTCHRA